jgi:hypothetical protein
MIIPRGGPSDRDTGHSSGIGGKEPNRRQGAESAARSANRRPGAARQQIPILLYRGQILDGRNRYRVCIELGIAPAIRAYDGDDPHGEAFSQNVSRRHLTTGHYSRRSGRG